MKKCPFCAEDIQDAAIKCKHCGEFLADTSRLSPPPMPAHPSLPFYFRSSFIVISLCCVGPLALPLIWFRPRTPLTLKILLTLAIIALSWLLYIVMMKSIQSIREFYQLMESF